MVHLQYNSSHPRFTFCWTTQYQFRFINTSEVALKFFNTTLPCISLCMYAVKYKYTNTILSNWEILVLYILSGGYYLRLACSTTSNVNFNFFDAIVALKLVYTTFTLPHHHVLGYAFTRWNTKINTVTLKWSNTKVGAIL